MHLFRLPPQFVYGLTRELEMVGEISIDCFPDKQPAHCKPVKPLPGQGKQFWDRSFRTIDLIAKHACGRGLYRRVSREARGKTTGTGRIFPSSWARSAGLRSCANLRHLSLVLSHQCHWISIAY
jgi:hypothetical protein